MLRWSALGLAVLVAAVLLVPTWRDSGAVAVLLLGLPAAVCLVAVLTRRTRYAGAVSWLAAAAVLGWALLLGLGIGPVFLPVAAVLAVAAARHEPARRRPLRR